MAGFTLIELMTVVALVAVLVAIGAPSFNDLMVSQRVKTAAFSFTGAAVFARSEAIKRNTDVVLAANAGGWQNGWNITAATGTTRPLDQQEGFPGGVLITNTDAQLTYQSSGRLSTAVGSIQVSGEADRHARCITFDLSGLPKSRMGKC